MKCSKCGAENEPDAEKCIVCGWGLQSRLVVNEQVCANHPWRFAVSTCRACGLELCEACEEFIDGDSFCHECADRPSEDELLRDVPVVVPAQLEPAGFFIRTIAAGIDILILGCALTILWMAFWLLFGDPTVPLGAGELPWARVLFWSIFTGGTIIYFVHSLAENGQTPGMASLDIGVVRYNGEALDYRAAILRLMSLIPAIVSIVGIFCAIWDSQGRMLHDRLTRTRVVKMGSM
ncbi:MAG TPA: RDD family protein [Armatimonadota bacterium]|nr:RDD family protein [Armatimonadota bacterium]HOM72612.1 RDD family protein [Armatimonadota bacterium]HPP74663.1 RDD family protein [Armatimonadota bacterium]